MDDRDAGRWTVSHGAAEGLHGAGHCRQRGLGGFTLNHPDAAVRVRKEKIDLEPLLVAEMIQLFPPALIHLALENLGRYVTFEKGTEEWGAVQIGLRLDAEEIASEAGISEIDLGRFDQTLAEILEVGRDQI
jgi:hypothetical protein